jgi:hypothetical protein
MYMRNLTARGLMDVTTRSPIVTGSSVTKPVLNVRDIVTPTVLHGKKYLFKEAICQQL